MEPSLTHSENRDTAAKDIRNSQLLLSSSKDQQMDGNGKRKAVIGLSDANTYVNDGIKASRKKLSLAMPLPPQSQKKDLCGKELTNGVSASCKENKKPHSNKKKLSLGLKQPLDNVASLNNNLDSSSFRDNNKRSRKLSLRPLGESVLTEIRKTDVLAQTDMEPEMNQIQDARNWRGEFEKSGLEDASMPDSIVVLDSDESGEEEDKTVSSRSRLSLARRRSLKLKN